MNRRSRPLDATILAVAVHSLVLGIMMLAFPIEVLTLLEWPGEVSLFFATQSGLFLLILGATYLAGLRQRCFLAVLVASKTAAPAFLIWMVLVGAGPRWLYAQALVDGAMGAAVAWAWWRETSAEPGAV